MPCTLLCPACSDGPAAVATFNVYSDHARLQGVATPAYLQRQGNATRLVKQLELVLADAGVQELAVILEPQVGLVATEFNIDWWCVHVFVANVKIPLPL
jgi:hypothetical protein